MPILAELLEGRNRVPVKGIILNEHIQYLNSHGFSKSVECLAVVKGNDI